MRITIYACILVATPEHRNQTMHSPQAKNAGPGPLLALIVAIHIDDSCSVYTGYAIADVNYGGSTGFGREYRNRLRGNWGVVDVDDCCNAAR